MVFSWIIIILLSVIIIRYFARKYNERYSEDEPTKSEFESIKKYIDPKKDETPIQILKERYAKGEISKEEFEKMKKDLDN